MEASKKNNSNATKERGKQKMVDTPKLTKDEKAARALHVLASRDTHSLQIDSVEDILCCFQNRENLSTIVARVFQRLLDLLKVPSHLFLADEGTLTDESK